MRALVIAMIVAATSPGLADAQLDSTLLGKRVRVRVNEVFRQAELVRPVLELRGTVQTVAGDSITVVLPTVRSPITVQRADMQALAVSRGVPSRGASALRRAVWWGLAGAYAGWLFFESPLRDPRNSWEDAVRTGAVIGVPMGLVIGFTLPYERWRRIRIR